MATARAWSAALVGVKGYLVEVEADVSNGPPATVLAGLPDTALRETRDRVRAAIINCGETWPDRKITVSLSPANLPKRGASFDLAIAVSVLAAEGAVPAAALSGVMFSAELGLDGHLRAVPGVLPAVAAAAAEGVPTVVVAAANDPEATLVPGMRVIPARTLAEVTAWLRGGPPPTPSADSTAERPGGPQNSPEDPPLDLAEIPGQPAARMAAEICAAGGHSLSLLGPPHAGKTMLAERLPTIMPRLARPAALEVAAIHSAAGMLPLAGGLLDRPPFCAPHYTVTKATMLGGGGGPIRPGAVSLAHRGVLFLDNAPEFSRDVLDALRQPLETGEATVSRSGLTVPFPARFSLVVAACPCPCAAAGTQPGECTCTPAVRRRYLSRLGGPLAGQIDLKVAMTPRDAGHGTGESSQVVRGRVQAARERTAHRLHGTPWQTNREIPGAELRRAYPPAPGAWEPIERAVQTGQISMRGAMTVLRIAWTIADLAGRPRPGRDDCALALGFLTGLQKRGNDRE
jgi:magnesium chelatase family protein